MHKFMIGMALVVFVAGCSNRSYEGEKSNCFTGDHNWSKQEVVSRNAVNLLEMPCHFAAQ